MKLAATALFAFFACSTARAAPAIGDYVDPAPLQIAVYEGASSVHQRNDEQEVHRDLLLGYSYLVLPGDSAQNRKILLVRSFAPKTENALLPAFSDAGFFWVGKGLEVTPVDKEETGPREKLLDMQLPPGVFPSFELPADASPREEEVRVIYQATARLPLRYSVVREGDTVTVTRGLAAGKTATLDLSGEPATVHGFREVYVVDAGRKVVTEWRREAEIVSATEDRTMEIRTQTELRLKEARHADGEAAKHAAALERSVEALLEEFRAQKHPRDVYAALRAIEEDPSGKLLDGLCEALRSRFSSYREAKRGELSASLPSPFETPSRTSPGLVQVDTPHSNSSDPILGKEAPDFTLEGLDGARVSLRQLAKGKVTLLSFWAYGCGPCRTEAPYLSRLQEEYGQKGFTVVAVNGWNEPRDMVQGFVTRAKLKQPVLLMGNVVAGQQYMVRGYPTSFWIDHEGKVIDREVGFNPAEFPAMRTRIEQLLAAARKK